MPMTGKDMVAYLEKHGFKVIRVNGSHRVMSNGDRTFPVPVHGNKDPGKRLESKILKQAGLK